jgi:hypothetical protein
MHLKFNSEGWNLNGDLLPVCCCGAGDQGASPALFSDSSLIIIDLS